MPDSVIGIFERLGVWIGFFLAAVAAVFGYGRLNSRVDQHHNKLFDSNGNERYITGPSHDKLQFDCQALWKSEFSHIRESLREIKEELKENRSR